MGGGSCIDEREVMNYRPSSTPRYARLALGSETPQTNLKHWSKAHPVCLPPVEAIGRWVKYLMGGVVMPCISFTLGTARLALGTQTPQTLMNDW